MERGKEKSRKKRLKKEIESEEEGGVYEWIKIEEIEGKRVMEIEERKVGMNVIIKDGE